jgi:hypothetical protein
MLSSYVYETSFEIILYLESLAAAVCSNHCRIISTSQRYIISNQIYTFAVIIIMKLETICIYVFIYLYAGVIPAKKSAKSRCRKCVVTSTLKSEWQCRSHFFAAELCNYELQLSTFEMG